MQVRQHISSYITHDVVKCDKQIRLNWMIMLIVHDEHESTYGCAARSAKWNE